LRKRRAHTWHFHDDGTIPNNRLPFVVYRSPIGFAEGADPAAVIEDLFETNGWGDSWRNGIYDYVHYHSRIHEVLGIARGRAQVRFGGSFGRVLNLKAGDVAIPKVARPKKDPVYGRAGPVADLWRADSKPGRRRRR
jgi:uncharacterized protein YjlB